MTTGDAEFGCKAFGHLASPFADRELSRNEQEGFATHLDTCRPCGRLIATYRAIDVAARSPVPPVAESDWDRAWDGIRSAVEQDRAADAAAPLAFVSRLGARLAAGPRRRWLRPLGYAAAAGLLLALSLSLQRVWDVPGGDERLAVNHVPPVGSSRTAAVAASGTAATKLLSLSCQAPNFVPVVYTIDGDNPMTVVQCAWVGDEPPPAPTTG